MTEKRRVENSGPAARVNLRVLRFRLLLAVITACFVGCALVFPFPVDGRLWGEVFDLAHAPVFFLSLVTIVAFFDPPAVGLSDRFAVIFRMTIPWVLTAAGLISVVGIAGEFAQGYVGRMPAWSDVAANTMGLLSAVCWIVSRRAFGPWRDAWILGAVGLLAAASWSPILGISDCIAQLRSFPAFASFERPKETGNWATHNSTMKRTTDWATFGRYALEVELQPGRYPAVSMTWPPHDWTGYNALVLDLRNPDDRMLSLTLKIFDRKHALSKFKRSDRFSLKIELNPDSTSTVRVDLKTVRSAPRTRSMDMDQIVLIEMFATDLKQPQRFQIDNIRLE